MVPIHSNRIKLVSESGLSHLIEDLDTIVPISFGIVLGVPFALILYFLFDFLCIVVPIVLGNVLRIINGNIRAMVFFSQDGIWGFHV